MPISLPENFGNRQREKVVLKLLNSIFAATLMLSASPSVQAQSPENPPSPNGLSAEQRSLTAAFLELLASLQRQGQLFDALPLQPTPQTPQAIQSLYSIEHDQAQLEVLELLEQQSRSSAPITPLPPSLKDLERIRENALQLIDQDD